MAELVVPAHGHGRLLRGGRARLRHYLSIERVDAEGIVERQCIKCGDWMVLDLFKKDINCHRGRTRVCKPCRQKRRKELGWRS